MQICDVEWCDRPARAARGGYCIAHQLRAQRGSDMDAPIRSVMARSETPKRCTFEDCTVPHYSAGLCQLHYHRRYMGRDMRSPRRYESRVSGVSYRTTKQGYVHIWCPDHPAAFGAGYVMAHRYVMEQHIGRLLLPGESVHHRNGVRDDNRIANLELWSSNHPAGQRVADLVSYAREILDLYGGLNL